MKFADIITFLKKNLLDKLGEVVNGIQGISINLDSYEILFIEYSMTYQTSSKTLYEILWIELLRDISHHMQNLYAK